MKTIIQQKKEKFFFLLASLISIYAVFLVLYYTLFEHTDILDLEYYMPHLAFALVYAATTFILSMNYPESCCVLKQKKTDESLYSSFKNTTYFVVVALGFAFGFNLVVLAIIWLFDYETSTPVFLGFILTCVYSLLFFVYGHFFAKLKESPYYFPSGVRKLIVFFKYYFSFNKPWSSFVLVLAVLTFMRCVPYFPVVLTLTSIRFNHLLYVSVFYLFSLFLTFIVYFPRVQLQLKARYGNKCLRLLGW